MRRLRQVVHALFTFEPHRIFVAELNLTKKCGEDGALPQSLTINASILDHDQRQEDASECDSSDRKYQPRPLDMHARRCDPHSALCTPDVAFIPFGPNDCRNRLGQIVHESVHTVQCHFPLLPELTEVNR